MESALAGPLAYPINPGSTRARTGPTSFFSCDGQKERPESGSSKLLKAQKCPATRPPTWAHETGLSAHPSERRILLDHQSLRRRWPDGGGCIPPLDSTTHGFQVSSGPPSFLIGSLPSFARGGKIGCPHVFLLEFFPSLSSSLPSFMARQSLYITPQPHPSFLSSQPFLHPLLTPFTTASFLLSFADPALDLENIVALFHPFALPFRNN